MCLVPHPIRDSHLKWGIYCGIVNANVSYNSTTVHPFQYVRRCPRMSQLFVSYLQWLTIEAALTKATKFLPTKPSVNSHQVLDFWADPWTQYHIPKHSGNLVNPLHFNFYQYCSILQFKIHQKWKKQNRDISTENNGNWIFLNSNWMIPNKNVALFSVPSMHSPSFSQKCLHTVKL